MIGKLLGYVNVIKSVHILSNGKIISKYWKYLFILLIKIILTKKIFDYILTLFDEQGESIQIDQTIGNVERCFIIENNKQECNIFRNANDYLDKNKENIIKLQRGKKIIVSCNLIGNESDVDLKNIFSKYMTSRTEFATIGNIIKFNNVNTQQDEIVKVIYYRNGRKSVVKYVFDDVQNMLVYDFYNI
jgi:hypothetical protein